MDKELKAVTQDPPAAERAANQGQASAAGGGGMLAVAFGAYVYLFT